MSTLSAQEFPARKLRTLSLMPTWQCTANCESCGTFSSPKVHTSLTRDQLFSAIAQAAKLDYGVVVFTGGEPTLRWTDLLASIRFARESGLPTRIVTNAHWATESRVDACLNALVEAGLNELNLSTGDEHARFVSLENVARAIVAGTKLGLNVWTMVELHYESKVTAQTLTDHPILKSYLQESPASAINISESPWMPMDTAPRKYPGNICSSSENLPQFRGCDSVLSTTTIEADGTIRACCGLGMRLIPELRLGSITDTSIERATNLAESDFLKLWMRAKGPEHILAWASSKNPTISWEGNYAHPCQACLRVYSDDSVRAVIREHHVEMVAEVVMSQLVQDGAFSAITAVDDQGSDAIG